MSNQEHLVAVIDHPGEAGATIDIARETVNRGGRATLILLLTADDRKTIQALAEGERLSIGEAEAVFVGRLQENYRRRVGAGDIRTIVRNRPSSARAVLAAASQARATTLAVPSSVARHRRWGRALSRSPLPIVVTPPRAA
jgi:hypothetical protein